MKKERTIIGYEFYPHGRGEFVHLSLTVHEYEVKDAMRGYQEAVSGGRADADWHRQHFECVEARRSALSVPWGKPGQYLDRYGFHEASVEIKWQASAGLDGWYGPRVETLSIDRGNVDLFGKLMRRIDKQDALVRANDRPTPEDFKAILKELKAVPTVLCEMQPSGHFWLPVADEPVPESPFKKIESVA